MTESYRCTVTKTLLHRPRELRTGGDRTGGDAGAGATTGGEEGQGEAEEEEVVVEEVVVFVTRENRGDPLNTQGKALWPF